MDQFLVNMVRGKLKYWTSTNLSLARWTLIVNQFLMSSLLYFIVVWVGSKRVIGRIEALFHNYLWSGSQNIAKARVSWEDCTIFKKVRGVGLISPKNAIIVFHE